MNAESKPQVFSSSHFSYFRFENGTARTPRDAWGAPDASRVGVASGCGTLRIAAAHGFKDFNVIERADSPEGFSDQRVATIRSVVTLPLHCVDNDIPY